jgi:Yip1 domain
MGPLDQAGEENPYAPPSVRDDVDFSTKSPTKGIDLSRENPFLTIWTRPRATIRGIVETDATYRVLALTSASGIVGALNNAAQRNAGDRLPISAILGMAIVLGPIGGIIGLYVGAWFVGLSGRWLGGRADSEDIRAALAWSAVPTLVVIPIWIVQLAVFGHEMFTSEMPSVEANPMLYVVVIATGVAEFVLAIWSLVILLKTLGEVQGFSAWRALGSMLLITLIVLIPFIVLAIVVLSLSR